MKGLKLVYFCQNPSSFVLRDVEALSESNQVELFAFNPKKKWMTLFAFVRQLFFLLPRLNRNHIYFSRFAGYHSLLPSILAKITGIKHYIILGGTDANALKSIGYGHALRPLLGWATRVSMQKASKLLPISQELVHTPYTYTDKDGSHQGYKAHFPQVETPYEVIPIGIETDLFKLLENTAREANSFVTICKGLESERRRLTKGIDMFIEMAKAFPDCPFTIIGDKKPALLPKLPNVTYLPFVPNKDLPAILNTFGFYVQLSLTEGFSNALLEGMACGCIPIVSRVGPMPKIAENYGYVLKRKDVNLLKDLVSKALVENQESKRNEMSNFIHENYSTAIRKEKLNNLLKGIAKQIK